MNENHLDNNVEELTPTGEQAIVTTMAEQAEKEGKTITLTQDQARQMALQHYEGGLTQIQQILSAKKLSVKQLNRVMVALLQLPDLEGGVMKSYLKTKEEKILFDMGQRVLAAKYAILMDFVAKQEKLKREQEQLKQEQTKEVNTNE